MIIVIAPETLDRVRKPVEGEPDNALLEWECALDLFKAGWIQLLVVHHSSLPKPTTDAAKNAFLADIPDKPTKLLQYGAAEARPRLTALEILEELVSPKVPWVADQGLHEAARGGALVPQAKGATRAMHDQAQGEEAGVQAASSKKLQALARVVDEKWDDYFSWHQQGGRALGTARQAAMLMKQSAVATGAKVASRSKDLAGSVGERVEKGLCRQGTGEGDAG